MRLANKVAIITGGGSGIGLAAAQRFAQEGAKVAIVGRTAARLEAALRQIEGEAMAVPADVSRAADAERIVQAVVERWGRIDILVNNAAVPNTPLPVHELSLEEWNQVLTINLTGYFLLTKTVLPRMMAQRSGVVIMVGSEAAQSAHRYLGAYNASKGGVISLMRTVAAEYGEYGIRCNCLQVGATRKPQAPPSAYPWPDQSRIRDTRPKPIPLGRHGTPDDHAFALIYLASDESAWVTGAVLNVDGGYTVI